MKILSPLLLGAAALVLAGAPALAANYPTESLFVIISESKEPYELFCMEAGPGLRQYEEDYLICKDTQKRELGKVDTVGRGTCAIPPGTQTNCYITTKKIKRDDPFFLYLKGKHNTTVELCFKMMESADKKLELKLTEVKPVMMDQAGGRAILRLNKNQEPIFKESHASGDWFIKLKKDSLW
jgi:hypothetical protein